MSGLARECIEEHELRRRRRRNDAGLSTITKGAANRIGRLPGCGLARRTFVVEYLERHVGSPGRHPFGGSKCGDYTRPGSRFLLANND